LVKFFENEFIAVRNLDRVCAEHSRAIIRNHGLKPADAIHVATALLPKVDVLHTYDKEHLIPLDKKIIPPQGGSPLRIEEPHWDFQPAFPEMST
jgi:PIN domain